MVTYIPELKENGLETVTIKHLLQMTSGIAYNESYVNPFGDAADYYYGTDLLKSIKKRKARTAPKPNLLIAAATRSYWDLYCIVPLKLKTLQLIYRKNYGSPWVWNTIVPGIYIFPKDKAAGIAINSVYKFFKERYPHENYLCLF